MNRIILILALLTASFGFSQYDMNEAKDTTVKESKIDRYALKQKIYVGADLSLSFGNSVYLYLGPLAGYDIWGGISAGVKTMYQYRRLTFANGSSISESSFGGGIFARWRPETFPYVLLQTEFDLWNTEDLNTLQAGDRTTVPAFSAGLGYAGGIGRAYYSLMLFYDFLNNPNNPMPRFFGDAVPIYIRYGMVFYLG